MNINKLCSITKGFVNNVQPYRLLNMTTVRPLIQKWRDERGLPLNPNAYGVLTDKADYTFLDGRVTPYGTRQKKRIIVQQQLAQKIIDLTYEVDFAVERHQRMQLEEKKHYQEVLDSKLKPKGNALLKK